MKKSLVLLIAGPLLTYTSYSQENPEGITKDENFKKQTPQTSHSKKKLKVLLTQPY